MYANFEPAICCDPGDLLRFTYPLDRPLAAEFEEQITILVREYMGVGSISRPITWTGPERWTTFQMRPH